MPQRTSGAERKSIEEGKVFRTVEDFEDACLPKTSKILRGETEGTRPSSTGIPELVLRKFGARRRDSRKNC